MEVGYEEVVYPAAEYRIVATHFAQVGFPTFRIVDLAGGEKNILLAHSATDW